MSRKKETPAGNTPPPLQITPGEEARWDEEGRAAMAETDAILKSNPERLPDWDLPINQYHARLIIRQLEHQYAHGERGAILTAIMHCARTRILLPDWVAEGFIASYEEVAGARLGSWDEAFGRPYPKGTHLEAARRRQTDLNKLLSELMELMRTDPERPIDGLLFEDLGAKLGCGQTRASELYYQLEAESPHLVAGIMGKPKK